jgi:hypothetical protein
MSSSGMHPAGASVHVQAPPGSPPASSGSKKPFAQRIKRRVGRRLSHWIETKVVTEKGPGWVSYRTTRSVVLRRGSDEPTRGIYLRGACDVPSLFVLPQIVLDELQGTLCIHLSGTGVSDARSDLLLQTYTGVSPAFADEIGQRVPFTRGYFDPTLFEPDFSVQRLMGGQARFPKTVVVLSVLPDLGRTLYRHRESGYLIDPGSAWLNSMASALKAPSFVAWFNTVFESIGRISVEGFAENLRRLVPLVRQETGAEVMIFNSLEIEPFDPTFDYSVRNLQSVSRRRRFNIALAELATEVGFHVIDLDRVLKEQGVERQVDFAHFPVERMTAVAAEAQRVLRDIGVL